MTRDEFWKMIRDEIGDYLPDNIRNNCTVECTEVMKNNDNVLKGITFNRGDNVPCPTFYIEDAYAAYRAGESKEVILEDLAAGVEMAWEAPVPIAIFEAGYEEIKDKLTYQLVDVQHNQDRLKSCVHTKLNGDLALIYFISVEQPDGYMRALVTNDLVEIQGFDAEQLKQDAKVNMEKMYPPTLFSPPAMMMEMLMEGNPTNLLEEKDVTLNDTMYVLSNKGSVQGASAIMYEDIQEQLGNMIGGNYYVIPSSTQEVMIVPVNGGPDAREILSILNSANEQFVSKEEFLSNRLFMYDRGEKLLAEVKVPNREVEMER